MARGPHWIQNGLCGSVKLTRTYLILLSSENGILVVHFLKRIILRGIFNVLSTRARCNLAKGKIQMIRSKQGRSKAVAREAVARFAMTLLSP